MIELLQNEAGTLLGDLQDQAMRLLDVEGSDEHRGVARTDLDDVIAFPHAPAFFVEDDSVFVEDAGLSVDNSARLCKFSTCRTGAAQ